MPRSLAHLQDAPVADADTMGVERQVLQDLFGPGERALRVDHPLPAGGFVEEGPERRLLPQALRDPVELQLPALAQPLHPCEILAPEHYGQGLGVEHAPAPGVDPGGAVQGYPAASDDAVQVVVLAERLSPGMQYGGDADSRLQLPFREGRQGGGGAVEEQLEALPAVLANHGIEAMRKREHVMEVGRVQKAGALAVQPLEASSRLAARAAAVAAAVGDAAALAAIQTSLHLRSKRSVEASQEIAQGLAAVGVKRVERPLDPNGGGKRPVHARLHGCPLSSAART